MSEYKELVAEIKKQMILKNVKGHQALAELTGFSKSTIDSFMIGRRYSKTVDRKIRKVLGISDDIKV